MELSGRFYTHPPGEKLYTPPRNIVEELQNYDRELYVIWNNKNHYFELWRKKAVGQVLITPITKSIYDNAEPREYTDVDQRIVWWVWASDSWRWGGPRASALEQDKRWIEFQNKQLEGKMKDYRDKAKDLWTLCNNNYVTKYKKVNKSSKNRYPSFNNAKPKTKWVRPDVQSINPRLFSRSKANAKKYNF